MDNVQKDQHEEQEGPVRKVGVRSITTERGDQLVMTTVFCHIAGDSFRKTKLYNSKIKTLRPLKTEGTQTLGKIFTQQLRPSTKYGKEEDNT